MYKRVKTTAGFKGPPSCTNSISLTEFIHYCSLFRLFLDDSSKLGDGVTDYFPDFCRLVVTRVPRCVISQKENPAKIIFYKWSLEWHFAFNTYDWWMPSFVFLFFLFLLQVMPSRRLETGRTWACGSLLRCRAPRPRWLRRTEVEGVTTSPTLWTRTRPTTTWTPETTRCISSAGTCRSVRGFVRDTSLSVHSHAKWSELCPESNKIPEEWVDFCSIIYVCCTVIMSKAK